MILAGDRSLLAAPFAGLPYDSPTCPVPSTPPVSLPRPCPHPRLGPPEAPGVLAPILLQAVAALVAREEGTVPSHPRDPIYRSPRGRTHPYLRARGGSFRTRRPPRRSPAVQRQVVGPLLQQPALAAQSQPLRLPPSLSQSASSLPCSASEPPPAAVPLPPPYTHPPTEASPPVHAPPAAPSFPLPPSAPPPGGPPVPPPPPSPRSQTGHAVTSPVRI
ncbi:unnamed protein product [Closterium sp. Naga37s-1]|nr:unnamed protein product [Closterium sp. Naga37s-1]